LSVGNFSPKRFGAIVRPPPADCCLAFFPELFFLLRKKRPNDTTPGLFAGRGIPNLPPPSSFFVFFSFLPSTSPFFFSLVFSSSSETIFFFVFREWPVRPFSFLPFRSLKRVAHPHPERIFFFPWLSPFFPWECFSSSDHDPPLRLLVTVHATSSSFPTPFPSLVAFSPLFESHHFLSAFLGSFPSRSFFVACISMFRFPAFAPSELFGTRLFRDCFSFPPASFGRFFPGPGTWGPPARVFFFPSGNFFCGRLPPRIDPPFFFRPLFLFCGCPSLSQPPFCLPEYKGDKLHTVSDWISRGKE